MAEYLSKEEVLKAVNDIMSDSKILHKFRSLRLRVNRIPTADVVEVKYGEWKRDDKFFPYCSACGENPMSALVQEIYLKYCPNCGAKMYGKPIGGN